MYSIDDDMTYDILSVFNPLRQVACITKSMTSKVGDYVDHLVDIEDFLISRTSLASLISYQHSNFDSGWKLEGSRL